MTATPQRAGGPSLTPAHGGFVHPNEATHRAERDRSYKVRVQRGDVVVANRDLLASYNEGFKPGTYRYHTVPAGARLTVVSESNAGFRGIEFFAWLDLVDVDGPRRYHVSCSTGAVTKVTS